MSDFKPGDKVRVLHESGVYGLPHTRQKTMEVCTVKYVVAHERYVILEEAMEFGFPFSALELITESDPESFIATGKTAKPVKEWQPDQARSDVMDITRGMF